MKRIRYTDRNIGWFLLGLIAAFILMLVMMYLIIKFWR